MRRFSFMKNKVIFIVLFLCIVVVFLNHRIPFFQPIAGGWSIGYGLSNQFPEKIEPSKNPMFTISQLKEFVPNTQFLADPFFIKEKDTFYIFFEHKRVNIHPAEIGLFTSVDGKKIEYKGTVLKEKFHLSYPQVFKHKGVFYMLPETQGANNVLLYKAMRFPYQWTVVDTLLYNTKLKDPTIYLSDTLNILVGSDDAYQLKLFNAKSLDGKWLPHKRHVVSQGTESRPGGRFLKNKNGLVLPVQNCTKDYGYGLSLYQFDFKNLDYKTKNIAPLFLKREDNIKEFNAGMHHLDIQKIDNRYFYVYDGNTIIDDTKQFSYKTTLKFNYLDFKNWLRQITN
jgi:hypothetical protein